jgi:transcriptional regulator with XRE-family HTH domain
LSNAEFYVELGRQIRDGRKNLGWRQEDLGAHVGLSRTSIANIEAGRQRLLAHELMLIRDALSLDFEGLKGQPGPEVAERRALVEENQRLHRLVGRIRKVLA